MTGGGGGVIQFLIFFWQGVGLVCDWHSLWHSMNKHTYFSKYLLFFPLNIMHFGPVIFYGVFRHSFSTLHMPKLFLNVKFLRKFSVYFICWSVKKILAKGEGGKHFFFLSDNIGQYIGVWSTSYLKFLVLQLQQQK